MLSGSCTHSLMYFNAFFTLTKNVRVITCCFHLVEEKNYWPINLFTSYIHIYSTRPHLICASFMWIRVMQRERGMVKGKHYGPETIEMHRPKWIWQSCIGSQIVNEFLNVLFIRCVCVSLFFLSANRWPQYKSRDMRSCGESITCTLLFLFGLVYSHQVQWVRAHVKRKLSELHYPEHSLKSNETIGDVQQHC